MDETAREKKIEDYLLGRLNEAGMQAFRLQMEQDPELQAAVKNHQKMLGQIDALYDYQASKLIRKVQQDAKSKKTGKLLIRRRMFWLIGAAAAIALLIFTAQWFSVSSNEDLYLAYYKAYELNFVQRGNTDDKSMVDAGTFYRAGDYEKALPLLEATLSTDPKNTHIRMAIGICYHELNNYEKALQTFVPLIENKDPLYLDQAHWYTALAYLKLDQTDLCKEQLHLLSNSASPVYKRQAQKLLEDLN